MNHETAERDGSPEGKGARPTARITTHKPDPVHELNLLRMMQVANEHTMRELGPLPLGGLPVVPRRKPKLSQPRTPTPVDSENEHREDGAMKVTQLAAMAALVLGTAVGSPVTSTADNANAASTEHPAQTQKVPTSSVSSVISSPSISHAPKKTSAPRLGPEYKKIVSFVEFRKKLLADGWEPVTNPKCREEVIGGEYCDLAPEMTSYTSTFPGYLITRYIKDGVPLSVLSEGDITDLIEPEKHGLYVDNWDYESGN